ETPGRCKRPYPAARRRSTRRPSRGSHPASSPAPPPRPSPHRPHLDLRPSRTTFLSPAPLGTGGAHIRGRGPFAMRVVVLGAGEVGYHLAERLSQENQDVVIVES